MHACMYVFICLHACFSLQHAGPHSFVEVPTQEEVKQKEEAAAALFREQAEAARRRGAERLREGASMSGVRCWYVGLLMTF